MISLEGACQTLFDILACQTPVSSDLFGRGMPNLAFDILPCQRPFSSDIFRRGCTQLLSDLDFRVKSCRVKDRFRVISLEGAAKHFLISWRVKHHFREIYLEGACQTQLLRSCRVKDRV